MAKSPSVLSEGLQANSCVDILSNFIQNMLCENVRGADCSFGTPRELSAAAGATAREGRRVELEFTRGANAGRPDTKLDASGAVLSDDADALVQVLLKSDLIALVAGADGRITAASSTAAAVFRCSEPELVDTRLSDLSRGSADGRRGEPWLRPGRRQHTFDADFCRMDGSTFPARAHLIAAADHTLVCLISDRSAERRCEQVQGLMQHAVAQAMSGAFAPDAVLRSVCAKIRDLYTMAGAFVALADREGALSFYSGAGEIEADGPAATALLAPARLALKTGELSYVMAPVQKAPGVQVLRPALALPLRGGDRVSGTLTLLGEGADGLSPDELRELRTLAAHVAVILEVVLLQERAWWQAAALEAIPNALVVTDHQGVIVWVNAAFTALTGYTADELEGANPRLLKSGCQDEEFYREMWATLSAGRVWQGQMHNRRKNGTLYLEEQTISPVRGPSGDVVGFISVKHDATDRHRQEAELRYQALHDPVTGLPNRRALLDALASAVSDGAAGGALLMIDLDSFKLVNDTQGHAAGDALLVTLTEILRSCLRPGDLLARLGGDEFAVLLQGVSALQASDIAERIRLAVWTHTFTFGGTRYDISASVGAATIDGSLPAERVLAVADSALYAAKEQGKNRVVTFRDIAEQPDELMLEAAMTARIKEALLSNRLVLHYQPVIRLATGKTDHYEVLLRLRDRDGNLLYPKQFMGPAERSALAPALDLWVVGRSLELLEANPDVFLFVNLSGRTLSDEACLERLEILIHQHSLVADRIAFEVTETAAVRDLVRTATWMQRIRQLGCRFALDDFGSGFASFSYLRTLPTDFLKIDGSLIRTVTTDPSSMALVEAMQTLARALGKSIIAEWVETEEVAVKLAELGVEHGQGFVLGRPRSRLAD